MRNIFQLLRSHFYQALRGEESFRALLLGWGVIGWVLWALFIVFLLLFVGVLEKVFIALPARNDYARDIMLFLFVLLQASPSLALFFLWKRFGKMATPLGIIWRVILAIFYVAWIMVAISFSFIVMTATISA